MDTELPEPEKEELSFTEMAGEPNQEEDLSFTEMAGEPNQDIEALIAENQRLREEVSRLALEQSAADGCRAELGTGDGESHGSAARFRPPWQPDPDRGLAHDAESAAEASEDLEAEITAPLAPVSPSQRLDAPLEYTALPGPSPSRPRPAKAQAPRQGEERRRQRHSPGSAKAWSPSGKDSSGGIQPSPTLLGGSYAMGYRDRGGSQGGLSRRNGGSVSLPAIGTASPSRAKKEGSSTGALLDSLRQALISGTGSLKRAYDALDHHKTGMVDAKTLKIALDDVKFQGRQICELPSAHAIFDAMEEDRAGTLSLQKLLDFSPSKKEIRSLSRMKDTHALWSEYSSKTSAQPVKLERQPRWRSEASLASAEKHVGSETSLPPIGADWDSHLEAKKRRRDLRKQFREDRQGIKAEQKRELIQGLVPPEESIKHVEQEQRKMEGHRQRIHDAIKACSKSRLDLVEMQRQMAGLAPEEPQKEVFKLLKNNFQAKSGGSVAATGVEAAASKPVELRPARREQRQRKKRTMTRSYKSVAFDVGLHSSDEDPA